MATTKAVIDISINTSDASAQLRNLQTQINAFNATLNKTTAAHSLAARQFAKEIITYTNASQAFTAEQVRMETSARRLDQTLTKGRGSLGQYFSAKFNKNGAEAAAVLSLANARAQALETQFVKLTSAAGGFRDAIAIRPLQALNDSMEVANQRAAIHSAMFRQATTSMINFGKNTQWAGRQLMVGFTVPMTIFGAAAGKTFKEIEQAAVRFKKVYGDAFTTPAEIEKNMKAVEGLALEFTKYGIAVKDTIGLAAEAAAAGAQNADLIAATTEATRLATLGQMEQQEALTATIALQNAFKLSAQDLSKEVNFLNMVENQTVVTLQDLAGAIPRVAPVIVGLGGDIRDMAAMLAAMQEGGVSAAQGANALKSGLGSLINPTEKASKVLAEMGVNINSIVQANRGDLMGTVTAFAQALSGLDKFTRQQALEELFGKYQYARLGALFENIIKDGTQASRVLQIAGLSAEQMAKSAEKELSVISEATSTKYMAAMERFKLAIAPVGEMFMKISTPIINFFAKLFEMFDKLPEGAKTFTAFAAIIVGVVVPAGTMFLGLLMNLIGTLAKFGHIIGVAFKGFAKGGIGGAITAVSQSLRYMGLEEINAAQAAQQLGQSTEFANAALLDQVAAAGNARLAIDRLTQAYDLLINKQLQVSARSGTVFGAGAAAGQAAASSGATRVQRRNRGGKISYMSGGGSTVPGFGNTDTVPAMLTPGEFVVNKKATQENLSLLHAINNGKKVGGFNKGGRIPGVQYLQNAGRVKTLQELIADNYRAEIELGGTTSTQSGNLGFGLPSSTRTLDTLSPAELSLFNSMMRGPLASRGIDDSLIRLFGLGIVPTAKEINDKLRLGTLPGSDASRVFSNPDIWEPMTRTSAGLLLPTSGRSFAESIARQIGSTLSSRETVSDDDIYDEVERAMKANGGAAFYDELQRDPGALRLGLPELLSRHLKSTNPQGSVGSIYEPVLSQVATGVRQVGPYKGRPGVIGNFGSLGWLLLGPGKTLTVSGRSGRSYENEREFDFSRLMPGMVRTHALRPLAANTGGLIQMFNGGGRALFLGMPHRFSKRDAEIRSILARSNAEATTGRFAGLPVTDVGNLVQSIGGRSSTIPGVNGVYEVGGKKYVVKTHETAESALAEARSSSLMKSLFGLTTPEQELIKMRHPQTGDLIFGVRSPYDPKIANPTGKIESGSFAQQLIASAIRRDSDLQPDNIFGSIVADSGAAIFGMNDSGRPKASQPRLIGDSPISVLEQLDINLLRTKGGAKKFFAEASADIARNMTPDEYESLIRKTLADARVRAQSAVDSLPHLTESERDMYLRTILGDLDSLDSVDWKAIHAHHKTVMPEKKRPPTAAALKKAEEAAIKKQEEENLRIRQRGHNEGRPYGLNWLNGGGIAVLLKNLAESRSKVSGIRILKPRSKGKSSARSARLIFEDYAYEAWGRSPWKKDKSGRRVPVGGTRGSGWIEAIDKKYVDQGQVEEIFYGEQRRVAAHGIDPEFLKRFEVFNQNDTNRGSYPTGTVESIYKMLYEPQGQYRPGQAGYDAEKGFMAQVLPGTLVSTPGAFNTAIGKGVGTLEQLGTLSGHHMISLMEFLLDRQVDPALARKIMNTAAKELQKSMPKSGVTEEIFFQNIATAEEKALVAFSNDLINAGITMNGGGMVGSDRNFYGKFNAKSVELFTKWISSQPGSITEMKQRVATDPALAKTFAGGFRRSSRAEILERATWLSQMGVPKPGDTMSLGALASFSPKGRGVKQHLSDSQLTKDAESAAYWLSLDQRKQKEDATILRKIMEVGPENWPSWAPERRYYSPITRETGLDAYIRDTRAAIEQRKSSIKESKAKIRSFNQMIPTVIELETPKGTIRANLDDIVALQDQKYMGNQTSEQERILHNALIQVLDVREENDGIRRVVAKLISSQIPGFNTGGFISPTLKSSGGNIVPGTGNTDTVPAMLTPGEFVINKQATMQNLPLLHAINSGSAIRANKGGFIGVQYLQDGGMLPGMNNMLNLGEVGPTSPLPVNINEVGGTDASRTAMGLNPKSMGVQMAMGMGGMMAGGAAGGMIGGDTGSMIGSMLGGVLPLLLPQSFGGLIGGGGAAGGAGIGAGIAAIASNPVGWVIGGVAAAAAVASSGLLLWRKNIDDNAKETANMTANIGQTSNSLITMAKVLGVMTPSQRQAQMTLNFTKQEQDIAEQLQPYFESEMGQKFVEDLKGATSEERFKKLSDYLSSAIASGMLDKTQAKAFAKSLSMQLGDPSLAPKMQTIISRQQAGSREYLDLANQRSSALMQDTFIKQVMQSTGGVRSITSAAAAAGVGGSIQALTDFADAIALAEEEYANGTITFKEYNKVIQDASKSQKIYSEILEKSIAGSMEQGGARQAFMDQMTQQGYNQDQLDAFMHSLDIGNAGLFGLDTAFTTQYIANQLGNQLNQRNVVQQALLGATGLPLLSSLGLTPQQIEEPTGILGSVTSFLFGGFGDQDKETKDAVDAAREEGDRYREKFDKVLKENNLEGKMMSAVAKREMTLEQATQFGQLLTRGGKEAEYALDVFTKTGDAAVAAFAAYSKMFGISENIINVGINFQQRGGSIAEFQNFLNSIPPELQTKITTVFDEQDFGRQKRMLQDLKDLSQSMSAESASTIMSSTFYASQLQAGKTRDIRVAAISAQKEGVGQEYGQFIGQILLSDNGKNIDTKEFNKRSKNIVESFKNLKSEKMDVRKEAVVTLIQQYEDPDGNPIDNKTASKMFDDILKNIGLSEKQFLESGGIVISNVIDIQTQINEADLKIIQLAADLAAATDIKTKGSISKEIERYTRIRDRYVETQKLAAQDTSGVDQFSGSGGGGGGGGGGTKSILQQLKDQFKQLQDIYNGMAKFINSKTGLFKGIAAGPFGPQFIEFLKGQGEEGIKILNENLEKFKQVYNEFVNVQRQNFKNAMQLMPSTLRTQANELIGQREMTKILKNRGIGEQNIDTIMSLMPEGIVSEFGRVSAIPQNKRTKEDIKILKDFESQLNKVIKQELYLSDIQRKSILTGKQDEVKKVAALREGLGKIGISPEILDNLLEMGFSLEEITNNFDEVAAAAKELDQILKQSKYQDAMISMNSETEKTNRALGLLVSGINIDLANAMADAGLSSKDLGTQLSNDFIKAHENLKILKLALQDPIELKIQLLDVQESIADLRAQIAIEEQLSDEKTLLKQYEKQNDELSRRIELRQRDLEPIDDQISKLEEQKATANEYYDKQIEYLNEVQKKEQDISEIRKGQMDIASALSRGDVAGAAQAAMQMQQQMAQRRQENSLQAIEKARQQDIESIDTNINTLKEQRKIIENDIKNLQMQQRDIQDKIYNLNKFINSETERLEGLYGLANSQLERMRLQLEQQLQLERDIVTALERQLQLKNQIAAAGAGGGGRITPSTNMSQSEFDAYIQQTALDNAAAAGFSGSQLSNLSGAALEAEIAKAQETVFGGSFDLLNIGQYALGGMVKYRGSREPAPGMAFGGKVKKFAVGDIVPGRGMTDKVPALLTPGEFVVRKSVAQSILPQLKDMNSQVYPSMPTRYRSNGIDGLVYIQDMNTFNPISDMSKVSTNILNTPTTKYINPMSSQLRFNSSNPVINRANINMNTFPVSTSIMSRSTPSYNSFESNQNNINNTNQMQYNYNVNVYAETNANPEDIANQVVYKIKRNDQRQIRGTRV